MPEIEKTLSKIGMTKNEIKVYLTLNKEGSSRAGTIARLAHTDRSATYDSLRRLIEKGLASFVMVGNVKWFQCTGPRRLREYLKEQEEELEKIIPELHRLHKIGKMEGQVRIFKGIKGVKSIFMDILRKGQDCYVFGSEGQFSQRLPSFAERYDRQMLENKTKTFMLVRKGTKKPNKRAAVYREIDVAESPAVTNIYGSAIAIIIWSEQPEAILIENPAAAQAYKSYFDFMWQRAKK